MKAARNTNAMGAASARAVPAARLREFHALVVVL